MVADIACPSGDIDTTSYHTSSDIIWSRFFEFLGCMVRYRVPSLNTDVSAVPQISKFDYAGIRQLKHFRDDTNQFDGLKLPANHHFDLILYLQILLHQPKFFT